MQACFKETSAAPSPFKTCPNTYPPPSPKSNLPYPTSPSRRTRSSRAHRRLAPPRTSGPGCPGCSSWTPPPGCPCSLSSSTGGAGGPAAAARRAPCRARWPTSAPSGRPPGNGPVRGPRPRPPSTASAWGPAAWGGGEFGSAQLGSLASLIGGGGGGGVGDGGTGLMSSLGAKLSASQYSLDDGQGPGVGAATATAAVGGAGTLGAAGLPAEGGG